MRYPAGFLLIYFVVYLGIAFVWRSVVVYRSTGINPVRLPSTDDAHGYVGRMFKRLLVVCGLYLLVQTLDWDMGLVLSSINLMFYDFWSALGWVILGTSGFMLVLAQAHMGLSWRIGMDADSPGPLVTRGLFSYSRNPIFFSMRLNLLGLMCVLPHLFTLLLLVCGELLIQIQVRLEEAHLPKVYGAAYDAYCARVPRWC